MEKLESLQYSTARAITGAWKGTSKTKLFAELGWETLDKRRWSRRLFYKIINNITPAYTRAPYSISSGAFLLLSSENSDLTNMCTD